MSDALQKLQQQLQAAQRALAEAEARYVRQDDEHQSSIAEAENTHKQIEQVHRESMNVLDTVEDPIFVHDKNFRTLRCNQTYQRSAGISFRQIIGQSYHKVFPKMHAPLPNCLRAPENSEGEDEEGMVCDKTYRSCAYSVKNTQGSCLYSVHILEDINERLQANQVLRESELQYRRLFESAKAGKSAFKELQNRLYPCRDIPGERR